MNNDEVALYLNEHPEFFNDYPELLTRIKTIEESDLPVQPLKTLSIADRILRRVQQDKEHIKGQLEWFMEVAECNERILEHLFEIERICLYSHNFIQMASEIRSEIIKRFGIHGVMICLVDGADHFIASNLPQSSTRDGVESLRLIDQDTLLDWFQDGWGPVMRNNLEAGSDLFSETDSGPIRSEVLIPIPLHGKMAGALCLGSVDPAQFHEGLRTDYLERTAEKLGIAIDNVLLMEGMKNQSLLDPVTGLYNESYLNTAVKREFDRARRYEKSLSCVKLQIDYWDDLMNTCDIDRYQILVEIGRILQQNSRDGDLLFRVNEGDFMVLLPGICGDAACQMANRLKSDVEEVLNPGPADAFLKINLRIVSYPDSEIVNYDDFDYALSVMDGIGPEENSEFLTA
ncbi:DUF484 family protein [Nitrospina gracilis]|uniref:DUF484 family protein n=1 Tax=Nitrospina gracilis TaxID=35801 RepID=UPI001F26005B|nr:DUF484 family protein [Nitrospina gracilis]MCF8719176.1 diguanylate cyclase (GGDEF)-like protein [Nitrospina gracilis Nb-211]